MDDPRSSRVSGRMDRWWENFVSQRDIAVFAAAGYGGERGLGDHPAVLVVDMTREFFGYERVPILQSIERWPLSCGPSAWDALRVVQQLLESARTMNFPVIHTKNDYSSEARANRSIRNSRFNSTVDMAVLDSDIVDEIYPGPADRILSKGGASAFFKTPLLSWLDEGGHDTILVVGGTTSGCVRATVVDGASHGFAMAVVADGTFDRGDASHAISLFDMQMKYSDVISLKDAQRYLSTAPAAGGFDTPDRNETEWRNYD